MQHQTVLEYSRYRYLKVALLVVVTAIIAYVLQDAPVGRYGGTIVGYGLGIVAAVLIVWLMWFGVRKRQYKASGASLRASLSAHIYLGTTLVIIATLHASFQVGWNVHTLAYVLMLLVIASGFFGIYAYLRFPSMTNENLGEDKLEGLLETIATLDQDIRRVALALPEPLMLAAERSIEQTRIGGGILDQLRRRHPNCPTNQALALLEGVNKEQSFKGDQAQSMYALYDLVLRKQSVVKRARTHIHYKAVMDIWLFLHVPMSFALLAALVAHIIAVFFYR
jgi:hypothetical protein